MSSSFAAACRRIVNARAFELGVLALIVLGAAIVGLETSPSIMAEWGELLHLLDRLIVYAFVLEALLKMAQHGPHFWRYFKDPWNVFDFLIVVACLVPAGSPYAAVLRLARVLRALRLVRAVPRLQLLVTALLKSVPSMGYVGLLLFLHFYVYAVLGVFLFRDNDPDHFRDLQTSFLTLFRVITLEDWTDVMYLQMYGSDVFPYDDKSGLPRTPEAMPITGALYFVSFVLFGTMIMLNLFIGVIVNSMSEAQSELEEQAAGRDPLEDPAERRKLRAELRALEAETKRLSERLARLSKRGAGGDEVSAEGEPAVLERQEERAGPRSLGA